jgi:hypothetical protein
MADWTDHESAIREETRTPTGRCSHGFLAGLCVLPRCSYSESVTMGSRATSPPRRPRIVQDAPEGFYICTLCGRTKPLEEFYTSRSDKLGHQSRCKVCDNRTRKAPRK